jgi:chromosome segregation ATPase
MQQIAELERRITAALERIGRGVDVLSAPVLPSPTAGIDPEEVAQLNEALDEERMANAQLSERLRAVRDKEAETKAALNARIADLTRQDEERGAELNRLRRTVAHLTDELSTLRATAQSGLSDPAQINRALLAELEALRATRATEAAELADIVAALNPLIEEARTHA